MMNTLGLDVSKLDGMNELAHCAGWSVLFWDWAFVSDRPSIIKRDAENRLHCEDGPALSYLDGFAVYSVHGVRVPAWIIERPQDITPSLIEQEQNAEIRRVMIGKFGQEKYLMESGAEKICTDDYGTLWRKEIKDDEPMVLVEVLNSTAEPDGSWKTYFLRVPPVMRTPRQAIAWTFGISEDEYEPALQS